MDTRSLNGAKAPRWNTAQVVGYSGTPLAIKLGIKEGSRLTLVSAPGTFVLELPPRVVLSRQLRGEADTVVAFFTKRAKLEQRLAAMASTVFPSGSLWIAWPKKASGVPTDLTDNTVRHAALPRGLVDNKVCAIDGTWSALRFVWRLENRGVSGGIKASGAARLGRPS